MCAINIKFGRKKGRSKEREPLDVTMNYTVGLTENGEITLNIIRRKGGEGSLFRKVERALYEYSEIKTQIMVLECDLQELKEEEVEGMSAVDTTREGVSKTNAFSSTTENEAIKRVEQAERLQRMILGKRLMCKRIESALSILTNDEREIVELRYLTGYKMPWNDIAEKTGYSVHSLRSHIRNKIIEKIGNVLYCK